MKLRTDYRKHFIGGTAIAIASVILVLGGPHINQSLLIALVGTFLGAFIEGYQYLRGEGEPDPIDFLWTALPSWLLAGAHMVCVIQYPGGWW